MKADHVALAVHDRDVAGIAVVVGVASQRDVARTVHRPVVRTGEGRDIAGPEFQRSLGWVDQLAPLGGVLLGQQRAVGDRNEILVAHVGIAVGHGELDGLGRSVDVVGRIEAHFLQIVAFQHVQGDQLGRPLAGGRVLVYGVAAILGGDRLLHLAV